MKQKNPPARWQFGLLSFVIAFLLTVLFVPVTGPSAVLAGEAYTVQVVSATIEGGQPIELTLRNNMASPITVAGPIDVQVSIPEHALDFPRESLSADAGDVILQGESERVIAASETVTIAVIAPGLPDTWRPSEFSDHSLHINVFINIEGLDHHLERTVEVGVTPAPFDPGLVMKTNTPVPYDAADESFDGSLRLYLENLSDTDVTIEGPGVIQGTDQWSLEPGQARYRFDLTVSGPITIPAHHSFHVATIEGGPGWSWRNFYSPNTRHLTAWFQVTASAGGSGVWQSPVSNWAIVGEETGYAMHADISPPVDNEDGTASIDFYAYDGYWYSRVLEVADQVYDMEFGFESFPEQPVTGMTRDNIAIFQLAAGDTLFPLAILRVIEQESGHYRLIVTAAADGTYERIALGAARPADPELYSYITSYLDPDHLTVTLSTLNRPIAADLNPDSNLYEGTLEYPSINITFTSSEPIDASINLRQKDSTARPLPEQDLVPAGIYFDLNVGEGELVDTTILLEISYSRDDIPAGMNEADLKLFRYNETTAYWDLLPDQEIDTQRKIISVQLTGFSEFAVFEYTEEEAVDIPLTGDQTSRSAIPLALLIVLLTLVVGYGLKSRRQH